MNTIHKDDLDRKLKLNEIEVFTADQLKKFAEENMNEITKSEGSKDELMKAVADEIRTFAPFKEISVDSEGHVTSRQVFIRPAQILWDQPKEGEIQKSRSGTYMDTAYNKSLGRVGKRYGDVAE